MKTLQEYRDELVLIKDSPQKLSDLALEAGADYAYYIEQSGELEIKRAEFLDTEKYRTTPTLSDKACENKWKITSDGQEDVRIHKKLKGLEKLMAIIKNATVVATVSARNQY
jgi:hypothetical protein